MEKENNGIFDSNKDMSHAKTIIKEIANNPPTTRGRRSGSVREFEKSIASMSNKQLFELADYIGGLIEDTNDEDDTLGTILDNLLEHITGTI